MLDRDGSLPQSSPESGGQFPNLVDLLPVAVYVCEAPSGRITYYNSRAAQLWGREPRAGDTDERFCGSLRLWRRDGSELPHDQTPMALALTDGQATRNEEVVIERPDGSRITVLVNIDPLYGDAGRIVGAVNVFHDTTSLVEIEDVRGSLAAIIESSHDAIISKDLSGTIRSWNQGAEHLFGYTAAEAIGRSVTMLIPEDRPNEEPAILDRVRRGDRIDHYETVRQRKDGSRIDISLTVSPVRDGRGRVVGASKIARDITDRKHAEARAAFDQEATTRLYQIGSHCAKSGSRLLENLSEILDAAIWISGADKGNIQLFDEASQRLTIAVQRGFEAPFLEFFASVTVNDASACGRALGGGDRVVIEDVTTSEVFKDRPSLAIVRAAGVCAIQSTPLVSSTGAVLGMISTHFGRPSRATDHESRLLDVLARQTADYLERRKGEDQRETLLAEAEKARADAEAASRGKDEFLAMLGHELRNPLSAVRNAIAVAMLDESKREHALSLARRQADQLSRIVDDLLDVARITRGRVPLRRARVSLADVVQRTADGARAAMQERGHLLTLSLPQEAIYVNADPARLEQALTNLLTNAAKYSDPGGHVTVSAERQGEQAIVRVKDNGIGIPAEALSRIFDLFAQGDRSLDRQQGGLGIGLTLVRRIVEQHGGTVEAHSAGVGAGSEFVVRLPALAAADVSEMSGQAGTPTQSAERSVRVLLVEDHPDAAETLLMMLEWAGHDVRLAQDGLAALAAMRVNTPEIMLVDIGLPGMDGYELAKIIRSDDAFNGVLLVALTGYGRPEDKARASAAGFDDHFVKPVDPGVLAEYVSRFRMRDDATAR